MDQRVAIINKHRTFLRAPFASSAQSLKQCRFSALLAAITLMSLADLGMTLIYMRSIGMIELNPLAVYMIELGQTRQLILFKLFTIVLGAGLLYLLRNKKAAEPAAWIATACLAILMSHWMDYNRGISAITNELTLLASGDEHCEGWVRLDS